MGSSSSHRRKLVILSFMSRTVARNTGNGSREKVTNGKITPGNSMLIRDVSIVG